MSSQEEKVVNDREKEKAWLTHSRQGREGFKKYKAFCK